MEEETLEEIEADLTSQLCAAQPQVLARASRLQGRPLSLASFHATIGSKNNTFVDSIRTQFSDPDEFFAKWLSGLLAARYGSPAASRLVQLLKDPQVRDYTQTFLTRNFYRNLLERTRGKPADNLWSLWFGKNPLVWGLVIAPAFRKGRWVNDVSEIRRAKYKYWTVGHVLATGLIDPILGQPISFSDVSNLMTFYASVLSRVSNSVYEKNVASRYASYLAKSSDVAEEPFLIPELRYAGVDSLHKYRLDFAILNSHTMEFTGFELSPASTHMAVTKTRTRKQIEINRELADKWAHEMTKRNSYFARFGISTITFTDSDLSDSDASFARIAKYLGKRPTKRLSLADELRALRRA